MAAPRTTRRGRKTTSMHHRPCRAAASPGQDRRASHTCNRPRSLDFTRRWWHERASLPNSFGKPMKTFFLRFFTWWNGATFGTLLTTSLYGEFVGEDEFGNRYYRTKGGKIDPALGLRAALGDLQRRRRSLERAAILARLDASHRRCAADAGNGRAAPVVEAAPAQPHRHAGGASAHRLDPGAGPQAQGHRRLQGLASGPMSRRQGDCERRKSFWSLNFHLRHLSIRTPLREVPTSDLPYSAC